MKKGQKTVSQSKEEEIRIRGRGRAAGSCSLSFVNICMAVEPGKVLQLKINCNALPSTVLI